MIGPIDNIWQYSHYYGDMVATTIRLHDIGEDYAATTILFNALELIFKSIRGNFNQNMAEDMLELKNKSLITEDEYTFLNDNENGVRKIRNIATHRNADQYCIEDQEGIKYLFAVSETWTFIYNSYAPRIITILETAIDKSNTL